ncbi:hypothetical protein LP420_36250 [Massilia sp. B-10]|nr:hypothetical protein LP420_36250 [Massilia sp. B-10]
MHRRDIGRFERIGQDPQLHAAAREHVEARRPDRARHEIRRHQVGLVLRRAKQG